MTPIQKRAQMLIHGGAVQVLPSRRLPWARARRPRPPRYLWAAVWGATAVVLLLVGAWLALTLPRTVAL